MKNPQCLVYLKKKKKKTKPTHTQKNPTPNHKCEGVVSKSCRTWQQLSSYRKRRI